MKKTKKQMLNIILSILLIAILACITVGTHAWFTDQKSFSTGELKFGTIKIDVTGESVSADKLNVVIERSSGELTGKLMPGDTVSLKFNVALDANSEPAYYLVYLTGAENLFDQNCFYSDGTSIVAPSSENKTVGLLTTSTTHTFNITKQISTSFEAQGESVNITLEVYAIQKANLTKAQAYDEIVKKHSLKDKTIMLSCEGDEYYDDAFRNALGGDEAFSTYTKIGFYKTQNFDATGFTLNDDLTTKMNANLVDGDANQGFIKVYKKDTEIAIVSDYKIAAPKNCGGMFGIVTLSSSNLEELDFSNFYVTNKTTKMGGMFEKTEKLTTLDLSHFDTSNVTLMQAMFNGCRLLTSLDLSAFDTRKAEDMNAMFFGCSKLTEIFVGDNWVLPEGASAVFEGCGTDHVTKK